MGALSERRQIISGLRYDRWTESFGADGAVLGSAARTRAICSAVAFDVTRGDRLLDVPTEEEVQRPIHHDTKLLGQPRKLRQIDAAPHPPCDEAGEFYTAKHRYAAVVTEAGEHPDCSCSGMALAARRRRHARCSLPRLLPLAFHAARSAGRSRPVPSGTAAQSPTAHSPGTPATARHSSTRAGPVAFHTASSSITALGFAPAVQISVAAGIDAPLLNSNIEAIVAVVTSAPFITHYSALALSLRSA